MLVEDSPDTRDLVKLILEMENHEVFSAETGEAGIKKIREICPQLILMDISLPGSMSGLDVVETLRADKSFDETPIIALTAHALPQDQIRTIAAGCDEHISKPIFDLEVFAQTVSVYAEKGRRI